MTSTRTETTAAGIDTGIDTGTEAALAAYLSAHPDFLVRHPEVLERLHIPHGGSGVVSLVERQVAVLREQLTNERGRLNHLVARARDYEAFASRLHDLTVKLVLARDLREAQAVLQATLREEFNAEAVTLKLFPVDPGRHVNERTGERIGDHTRDPLVRAFVEFVDRDRCLCGPLPPAQANALFGAGAVAVQSAVLIPLKGHEQTGVLAIGSNDPKRFTPDMGTDLLARLGAITSAKLTALARRGALTPVSDSSD